MNAEQRTKLKKQFRDALNGLRSTDPGSDEAWAWLETLASDLFFVEVLARAVDVKMTKSVFDRLINA